MTEEWRSVPGYSGRYDVSSQGRVRSIARTDRLGRPVRGRILRSVEGSAGYLVVLLNRDGDRKQRTVHTLVAEAFIGPRPDNHDVCHWNGDRLDNSVANLRYDTRVGNFADAKRHRSLPGHKLTHCLRGHRLVLPNLVKNVWARKRQRNCLACSREYHLSRYHGRPFDSASADEKYTQIMSVATRSQPKE